MSPASASAMAGIRQISSPVPAVKTSVPSAHSPVAVAAQTATLVAVAPAETATLHGSGPKLASWSAADVFSAGCSALPLPHAAASAPAHSRQTYLHANRVINRTLFRIGVEPTSPTGSIQTPTKAIAERIRIFESSAFCLTQRPNRRRSLEYQANLL